MNALHSSFSKNPFPAHGRIKVRGALRLDSYGALPVFHLLSSTTHSEGLGNRPRENLKLQRPIGELSFGAFWPNYTSNLCLDLEELANNV